MDEATRLAHVSSLYGPGTFSAWILTIISVVISWTVNQRNKQKDIISNDFIAVLALPAIASVHILRQIPRRPVTVEVLFTSHVRGWLQESAAIEAPLVVCETFLAFSLLLFSLPASRRHRKRTLLVLVVSIMACSCECLLYAQTKSLQILLFNTTRTFLFQLHWAVLLLSVLLVIITLAFAVDVLLASLASEDGDASLRKRKLRRWIRRNAPGLLAASGSLIIVHELEQPWHALKDALVPLEPSLFPDQPSAPSGSFFPKTTSSIKDLDQAVSLGIGAITLAFSLHDALKSRRRAAFGNSSTEDCDRVSSGSLGTANGGLYGENISALVLDVDNAEKRDRNGLGPLARPDATYAAAKYSPKKEPGKEILITH